MGDKKIDRAGKIQYCQRQISHFSGLLAKLAEGQDVEISDRDNMRFADMTDPVSLQDLAVVVRRESKVAVRKLRRYGIEVVKSGRCNYVESQAAAKVFPKYEKYLKNK